MVAACLTHVCYCIWRKQVYVIANEGFGMGDRTGPAEESQEDETHPGMVSSNWVGYIVCNTH